MLQSEALERLMALDSPMTPAGWNRGNTISGYSHILPYFAECIILTADGGDSPVHKWFRSKSV